VRKWSRSLLLGAAVVVVGAACADADADFEIDDVRATATSVSVDIRGSLPSPNEDESFAVEFCPEDESGASSCVVALLGSGVEREPDVTTFDIDTALAPGPTVATAGIVANILPDDMMRIGGVESFLFDVPEPSGSGIAAGQEWQVGWDTTVPASTPPETSSTVTEASTTVVATPTSTVAGSTTTTTTRPSTTSSVPLTNTGGTATTTTSITATSSPATTTTTSPSTTTTTMFDPSSTTTSQPVTGLGEWIENDLTTCAYRGTMGCGIYRSGNDMFPDYGPVGGPGSRRPTTWGPVGTIAYTLYPGHRYVECSPACGWYYDTTFGEFYLGPADPPQP
jgi:hypothetical protein